MKIIFGAMSFDREREARRALRLMKKREDKNGMHGREVVPAGIHTSLAHYMHKCDDCGESYWDTDEYGGMHIRCRGTLRKAGF